MILSIKVFGLVKIDQRGFTIDFFDDQAYKMKVVLKIPTLHSTSMTRQESLQKLWALIKSLTLNGNIAYPIRTVVVLIQKLDHSHSSTNG